MNRGLSGPLAGTRGPMKLWHLARRVYHEALYQGSLSAAGSSTQRLVEKLSKDSRYITRQARMIQILGSFYLLIVTVLPASTMAELAGGQTHQWNMFVASIAGTIHMLVQTGYLMILTLVATSEILAPDLYRWPESLPIRAEQAGLLRVMALAREFLLPLAVIVFSYPIAAGISGGVPVALATLVVSVFHAALTLSITVLASWRLRRALRSASGGDRRATTVRVLTMAGYGIGIVLVLAVMQFGTGFVMSLLDHPRLGSATSLSLLRVFSLLPLPTSAATLVSSLVARHSALPMTLPLWMPLAGTSMYGVGALLLLKSAWRMIGRREADATQLRTFRRPLRQARDPRPATRLIVRTARAAFRRQIFQTASRDTQILLALFFPFVIPVAVLAGPTMSGAPLGVLVYIQPVTAAVLSGWFLVHGLSRLQAGTGMLEASLPLVERDRAFPRLALCSMIPAAGAMIAAIVLLPAELRLQGLVLGTAFAVAAPVGFLVKTGFFGRITGPQPRVVVDEVFVDHRFAKWLAALASVLAIAIGFILLWLLLGRTVSGTVQIMVYFTITGIAGLVVRLIAGRIFPRKAE